MNSCTAISGLILLVVTNLACIVSFATPYWLEKKGKTIGLWAECHDQKCEWVFEKSSYSPTDKDYVIASQGLMSVGLAVCLIALLVATLALCCQCTSCNHAGFVAGLLITAFLSMGIATAVYGIKTSKEENAKVSYDASVHFGWSFWVAVGAAGMALVTSLIYGCSSKGTDE